MSDDRFERLLRQRIGLDAASIGSASVERAVRERLSALEMLDTREPNAWPSSVNASLSTAQRDAYWLRLCASDDEVQLLIEAVVVPETWFFRDREAFVALAKMARERHARWPDRVLRLVSLPCSTGEEPYSIAMTLLDAGLPPGAFTIDAFDISTRALAHAARAVYGRNAFRGHALEFRDRHFTAEGTAWKLRDAVCRTVRFSNRNLFDPALCHGGTYDFVFCRNVLIYFDRDDQARAVDVLEQLLASDGTLFVGPSETGSLFRHAMQSARIPLAFAFHKGAAQADGSTTMPALHTPLHTSLSGIASAARREPAVARSAPRHSEASTLSGANGLRAKASAHSTPGVAQTPRPRRDTHAHASVLAVSQAPADEGRHALDAVRKLADEGRLGDASAAADAHLGTFGPSAEVFYLLGLIADADARTDEAAAFYRKTLYLDPAHYEALTHLATLLDMQGDRAGAHRLTQRAARANTVRVNRHG